MFTPCGDIQSPLLHLTQWLLCSLPVETDKVHCYTYLSVCYVHSSHHSLWRYTKSTATLTSVFVMFTPCGDIQSPLLHLPQCLLCSLQPPLPVEIYKVHCYTYLSVCYVHSSHHSLWRYTKSTATLTSVFVMFTPATTPCGDIQSPVLHCSVFVMFTPCGDIQSPLLHLTQWLLCSLPVETYKVHCYTYLSVCYVHSSHHSLWRYTKSTATLTSVFVMFTYKVHTILSVCYVHQPPLPVKIYKVHCYTYLCVCYVHSSHHSLWRHTKSTATLTSVFVMFTPATTPCGDIQSPLLHLP